MQQEVLGAQECGAFLSVKTKHSQKYK